MWLHSLRLTALLLRSLLTQASALRVENCITLLSATQRMEMAMSFEESDRLVGQFSEERDRCQFHNPKDMAITKSHETRSQPVQQSSILESCYEYRQAPTLRLYDQRGR